MTANRRIFLNIIATYGRSLYALVIGLFCGRWTLMILGEIDYGLLGLVGGLAAFVSLINHIMAVGVGRFYANSVGYMRVNHDAGLRQCHEWFTTAVIIHTTLSVVLILLGYPIGGWLIRSYLTIPPDRVLACLGVWQCVCVTTFIGMICVPFSAWYSAKQEIAELTVYGFFTATSNIIFLYYALTHPSDWLVSLAVWQMGLAIIPQALICLRAGIKYEECRFRWCYVKECCPRLKNMLGYSSWVLLGTLGDLLSVQGMSVLINKYFGPRFNASQTVGNTLSGQCTTLSGSMTGAFWPAIMNAFGARDMDLVHKLSYRICKIGTVCVAMFAMPLALEINEVLLLWLKNPPQFAAELCLCALLVHLIDTTTYGFAIAVHASGRIARYQIVVAGLFLTALPIAWLFFASGKDVYFVGVALIIARGACALMRLVMARKETGLSARYWIRKVGVPLMVVISTAFLSGYGIVYIFPASFVRIIATTVVTDAIMLSLCWMFLLDTEEKEYVVFKVRSIMNRFSKGGV